MTVSGTSRKRVFVLVLICSLCTTEHSNSQVIDDKPAIQVFPVQEQIGRDSRSIQRAIKDGEVLFRTKFNVVDGAGRPFATGDSKPTPRLEAGAFFARVAGPDASACISCHNEPSIGGSGDAVANVFVGAQFSDPPTLDTAPAVTNERNTITTFGSGLIEIVAAEMSHDLQRLRLEGLAEAKQKHAKIDLPLSTKGVSFGSILIHPNGYIDYRKLEGIDYDLIVKPFGVKGISVSLREFTIGALNQHHGIQAVERFGWERTGSSDFDEDGVSIEFSLGQVTALTLFQASLRPPLQRWSNDAEVLRQERNGERVFSQIGCAECHLTQLTVNSPIFREPNEYNRPGTLSAKYESDPVELDLSGYLPRRSDGKYVLRAFTDLKRHDMCDDQIRFFCNEKLKQDNVDLELFVTQKLWDVATSAPYGHRGDCSTISEVILGHGGEARRSRDAYRDLPVEERRALLSFLGTLGKGDVVEVVLQSASWSKYQLNDKSWIDP